MHTRAANRRHAGVIVLILSLASWLAGCGDDGRPEQPTDSPATAEASPVEGTWRTEPISEQAIVDTLTDAGLAEWIDDFFAVAADDGLQYASDDGTRPGMTVTLTLLAGQWTATFSVGDVVDQNPLDTGGTYQVDGDVITHTHPNEVASYRWTVENDRLNLSFVSVTDTDYRGIPIEVLVRSHYTAVPFYRDTP